ncbi:hypothetical protein GCM10011575_05280 [Microlunatus endophyticus]|uniref:Amidohydrolase-related domain-containing protein n=1 Tax=Microlunatus endophyticus TaxID=1716077 RepID=A0A917W173_9ACTN|nr:amidohydrolase family protein [Microlunatus endophyticus]GGL49998.1 hypothetical protein GCM10011575_05280 [Microlunatus endophyticus]
MSETGPAVADIVDAYAHIGLPRFQSLADYELRMRSAGIAAAALCSFDSSPDLAAIHDGLARPDGRFCGIGVPLGSGRDELEASVIIQLTAGFSGIRLSGADIAERSWLLGLIAGHGRVPLVCANSGEPATATVLNDHLDHHPDSRLVLGHFGGLPAPAVLRSGPVGELFARPQVSVIFSRQGGYPADRILPAAERLIESCGWRRVLWGSESPVLTWRNETLASALAWVDVLGPTAEQRRDFLGGNARRLFFDSRPDVQPLDLPFDPMERAQVIPATIFANGLGLDQRTAGALVHAWLTDGELGTFADYTGALIDRALKNQD